MVELKKDIKHAVKALLRELVETPTVNPPGENYPQAVEKIERMLEKFGVPTRIVEAAEGKPNLIAKVGRGKPVLLFNGHIDTVAAGAGWRTDPFRLVEGDGKLYGRGTADMKGSLAAMAVAAASLAEADGPLEGSLVFTATVDEETGGQDGLGYLVKRRLVNPDFCVVGEPTGLNVATCEKGACWYRITVQGKAAHGAVPEQGVNAVEKASKITLKLLSLKFRKTHRRLGKPTLNVGRMEGGVKINVVPDRCVVEVDRRTLPSETPQAVRREIKEALASLRSKDPSLRYRVEEILVSQPFQSPEEDPLVEAAVESVASVLGRKPKLVGMQGVTDARFPAVDLKKPTIILGAGSLNQAHKPNEYVSEKQLLQAVDVFRVLAEKILSGRR